eukprot:SAG31_NODE_61_length_29286_cov_444.645973_9_plen_538_part_00
MSHNVATHANAFEVEEHGVAASDMKTTYASQKTISNQQRIDDEAKDARREFGFEAENSRQWLFVLLDEPDSSVAARVASIIILALILLSCVSFVVETLQQFRAGHCEDVCEQQTSEAQCNAVANGLCTWVLDECLSYAGQARKLEWNQDDLRNPDTPMGGFVLDKSTIALNLDYPLQHIHQCSDTPEVDAGFYTDVDMEPTEADERICVELTDSALVTHGDIVYAGKMKDVCQFRHTNAGEFLKLVEVICVATFTVEYVLRMLTCTQRPREDKRFLSYFFKAMNLVDLASIVPFYMEILFKNSDSFAVLRILRMSRIFRVLKVGNYMHELHLFVEGYQRSRDGLVLLLCMLLLYLCVFGSILYLIEYPTQTIDCFKGCGHAECYGKHKGGVPGDFINWDMHVDCAQNLDLEWNVVRGDNAGFTTLASDNVIRDEQLLQLQLQNMTCRECCPGCVHRPFTSITTTWYFILATMTTVGYGDHYPVTVLGKFVTFLCMCCGILVVALPIIVVGNAFEEVFLQEVRDLHAREITHCFDCMD